MSRQRSATAALITLLAAASGCATSTATTIHKTLSASQLAPVGSPAGSGVELVAVPVQLGQWIGPGKEVDGMAAVALRVPIRGESSDSWFVSPTVEPTIASTDSYPSFDNRTIPMLPFGSFWVEITNRGAQPMALEPQSLSLELGKKTMKAIADSGALVGRWGLTLDAEESTHLGVPFVAAQARNQFLKLPVLGRRVDVPAGGTWKGYVVFDTGVYTADDYNNLLRRSGSAKLKLEGGVQVTSVAFKVASKNLPAVCLPKTKSASFRRCEVLVK